MKIKIDKFYQNTKGDKVQTGEYSDSDLPKGLAQYLVNNGHASVTEEDKPKPSHKSKPKPANDTSKADD